MNGTSSALLCPEKVKGIPLRNALREVRLDPFALASEQDGINTIICD
jgi:hypothetical protein